MRRCIEFVWNSITKKRLLSISILLLLILGIFISVIVSSNFIEQRKFVSQLDGLVSTKSYYHIYDKFNVADSNNDFNENIEILENNKEIYTKDKYYKFYEELTNEFETAEANMVYFEFNDKEVNNELKEISTVNQCLEHYDHEDEEELIEYKALKISDNFYDTFNIKLDNQNKNIQINSGEIPIVLGNYYKGKFNLNEVIDLKLVGEGDSIKAKIVGFIEKNTYSILGGDIINLYDYMLLPNEDIDVIKNDINLIREKIEGTFYITEDYDYENFVYNINNLSKENGLGEFAFLDYRYNLDLISSSLKEYSYTFGTLAILSIIFAVISVISVMINKVNSNKKTYAIHLVSGGTLNDIKIYLMVEIVLSIICSSMVALYFISFTDKISINYFINLIIIDLFLIFVISILPMIRINSIEVSEIIRRNN